MPTTSRQTQASITAEMQALSRNAAALERVLAEPWKPHTRSFTELAKRRLQVEHLTRAIEPVTARGVAYRLLAHGLIAGKDQFRNVVGLVRQMRVERRLPWAWITDEGRELYEPGGHDGVADYLARSSRRYWRTAWND